jgi:hypothetical protein
MSLTRLSVSVSTLLTLFGISVLTIMTIQLSHAASTGGPNQAPPMPPVSSDVYTYLHDYDNNVGGAGVQCHPSSGTLPYLTASRIWGSTTDVTHDTLTVNNSTPLPVHLLLNAISMNCDRNWSDLGATGALFPGDTSTAIPLGAYTNNFGYSSPPQPSVAAGQFTVYTNLTAKDAVTGLSAGSATLASSSVGSQTAFYDNPAGYKSTKYMVAKPVPFDFTPTSGRFTSSDPINISGTSYGIGQFCPPANWNAATSTCSSLLTIDCIGGWQNPNDAPAIHGPWNILNVLGYPTGPNQFLIDKCNQLTPGFTLLTLQVNYSDAHCIINSITATQVRSVNSTTASITTNGNGTSALSAVMQAGEPFTVNYTIANPNGDATWYGPSSIPSGNYDVGTIFNGASLGKSMAAFGSGGSMALGYPQNSSFTDSASFTAPVFSNSDASKNKNVTDGVITLRQGGVGFGTPCTFNITARRVFQYNPKITASAVTGNAVSGTANFPADNAPVSPGQEIRLAATVTNEYNGEGDAGEPYNWGITGRTASYSFATGISGWSTVAADSTSVSCSPTGSGTGTGVPPGGTPSSAGCADFKIPSNALDGQQYCFYAGATPGRRTDAPVSVGDPAYTSDAYIYPNVSSNFYNASTQYFNTYTDDVIGGVNQRGLCVEVENVRKLDLSVTQGDVHAGGFVGSPCTVSTNQNSFYGIEQYNHGGKIENTGSLPSVVTGSVGAYSQYIASAASTISGLYTGSGATSLTFGNSAATKGNYGLVCRPDMNEAALHYIKPDYSRVAGLVSGTVNLASLTTSGIYVANGAINIHGTVSKQITIFDPAGSGITVDGPIKYSSSAVGLAALPSFGVIEYGGSIYINQIAPQATTEIDGIYVAEATTGAGASSTNGVIYTCKDAHAAKNTSDCPSTLTVRGSMIANRFVFGRTGAYQGANSLPLGTAGNITTESIAQSPLLYLAPPPAFATQPDTYAALPQYLGEGLPFY